MQGSREARVPGFTATPSDVFMNPFDRHVLGERQRVSLLLAASELALIALVALWPDRKDGKDARRALQLRRGGMLRGTRLLPTPFGFAR